MLWFRAPAKINLTLHVIGRRADGYHEIESLVAFGGICDWLGYEPGASLGLEVCGPRATEAGAVGDNLVLRAARALSARIPRLTLGRFRLVKGRRADPRRRQDPGHVPDRVPEARQPPHRRPARGRLRPFARG